jgi:hypothetical protein
MRNWIVNIRWKWNLLNQLNLKIRELVELNASGFFDSEKIELGFIPQRKNL